MTPLPAIFQQIETTFDQASNAILQITRDRLDNASGQSDYAYGEVDDLYLNGHWGIGSTISYGP